MLERVIKDFPIRSGKSFGLVTFGHRVLRFGFLNFQKAFFIFYANKWRLQMALYYVEKVPKVNGDHEVHSSICIALPRSEDRLALGFHHNGREAVDYARLSYRQAVLCKKCCE